MKGAQYTIDHVTGYLREFVFNPDTIDENVRKILYGYDIKEIPLNKNREGYRRDIEIIDSFWRADSNQPRKSRHYNSAKSSLPDSTPTPLTPKAAQVSIVASISLETRP